MNKVFDGPFEYTMPWKSIQPRCDLRVYQGGRGQGLGEPRCCTAVVIFSEPIDDDYEGVSVTNAAEAIVSAVATKYKTGATRTIWIEHYPKTYTHSGGTFDLVTFDWDIIRQGGGFVMRAGRAVWRRVGREWVEELIGESF